MALDPLKVAQAICYAGSTHKRCGCVDGVCMAMYEAHDCSGRLEEARAAALDVIDQLMEASRGTGTRHWLAGIRSSLAK